MKNWPAKMFYVFDIYNEKQEFVRRDFQETYTVNEARREAIREGWADSELQLILVNSFFDVMDARVSCMRRVK